MIASNQLVLMSQAGMHGRDYLEQTGNPPDKHWDMGELASVTHYTFGKLLVDVGRLRTACDMRSSFVLYGHISDFFSKIPNSGVSIGQLVELVL